jgi:hypothetical protein
MMNLEADKLAAEAEAAQGRHDDVAPAAALARAFVQDLGELRLELLVGHCRDIRNLDRVPIFPVSSRRFVWTLPISLAIRSGMSPIAM